MMKTLIGLWLAALTAGTAAAGDCASLRAHDGEDIHVCRMAFNDNRSTKHRMGCFRDLDSGMRWLMRQAPMARGQFYICNCESAAGTVSLGEYFRTRGLAADPARREPRAVTSSAAASALAERTAHVEPNP